VVKGPKLRSLRIIFCLITAVGLTYRAADAQSTATLQGTVVDSQGATVSAAKVTVRNIATGQERTTESDVAGNFQMS
jgi:hypothetical protein